MSDAEVDRHPSRRQQIEEYELDRTNCRRSEAVGVLMSRNAVETKALHLTRGRWSSKCSIPFPQIVYGTSCLGNLYQAISKETKRDICRAWFEANEARPVVIDTAGKYGAGLALEVIGDCFRELKIAPEDVLISNKLGWQRTALRKPEPSFELGVWDQLKHDAVQQISYAGILECWQQGCRLLGEPYRPQLVSVHDPDEYLIRVSDPQQRARRLRNILAAYEALAELKDRGEVKSLGVGAKDWRVIEEIAERVELDWVMLAGCATIYRHPPEVLAFIARMAHRGIKVLNSAVFQGGFLIGEPYLDYREATPDKDQVAFTWRQSFRELCSRYHVSPALACIQFGLSVPGVVAVALNARDPRRVFENAAAVEEPIPSKFWKEAKQLGLIADSYPYLEKNRAC